MVKVHLKGTFGYGRPRVYYGPGVVEVPEGLARALGLTPLAEEVAGVEEQGGAALDFGEQTGGLLDTPGSTPLFSPDIVVLLSEAGFDTHAKVQAASDDELLAIKGIGPATLKQIRAAYGS